MRHPFETWPASGRRTAAIVVVVALAVTWAVLGAVNSPLMTDEAPRGVLSLQFAGNDARAEEIVSSWEQEGVVHHAGFSLGFDYLLMVLYGIAVSAAVVAASLGLRRRGATALAAAGPWLAWAAWLGAAFDGLENAVSFGVLDDPGGGGAGLVTTAAVIKFTLMGLAILYAGVGGLIVAAKRRSSAAAG